VGEFQPIHDCGKKQKKLDQYPMLRIQFWALMMGGGTAWNMQSIYSNNYHYVTLHLVGFAWILHPFLTFHVLRMSNL
jgi:hypothetical protein